MIFAKNSYSRLFFQNFPTEILISSKNMFIKVHTTLQDRCLCWGIFLKLGKLGGCVGEDGAVKIFKIDSDNFFLKI